MRGLKVLTTISLVVGLALMVAWPWVMSARPARGSPRAKLEAFGVWLTAYFSITLVAFALAAIGGLLIVRATRREFLARSKANMEALIEGLREDASRGRRAE
ncbi:MAG: hypothetical protein KIS66_17500 [Fimbriimonadaceae bacterium]|nr:hypothetical protein [Fimbriimonadaceae bacterium]